MESKQAFGIRANPFKSTKNQLMAGNNNHDHELAFGWDLLFYPKSGINYFESEEDRNKYDNQVINAGYGKFEEVQKLDDKFNFGLHPFKEIDESFDFPYNFDQEINFPNQARSYEDELTLQLDFSISPRCLSADIQALKEENNPKEQAPKEANVCQNNSVRARKDEEIRPVLFHNFSSQKVEERKGSGSSSPISVDSAKLQKLLKCLNKTKGVDKSQIDEDIVARTIEFGQQKVAESLNIPYRRYKSILNKVGIKTSAGRKVNNLQFETQLVEWALSIKNSGKTLTRKMVKDKASMIIKELILSGESSLKKFNLSKGWLDKFVRRHEEIRDYLTSQKGKKGQ